MSGVEKINEMTCGAFRGSRLIQKSSLSSRGNVKFCQDVNGKIFVVKDSMYEHWKINEFVAGKLAKHFIGRDVVANISLERNEENNRKFTKIEIQPNLIELSFFKFPNDRLEYFTYGYNVRIKNNNFVFSSKYNSNKATTVYGKEVEGLYESFLFTLWAHDQDTYQGHNFALLMQNNSQPFMTRMDFDDSFKFFDLSKHHPTEYKSIHLQLIEGDIIPYRLLDKKKFVVAIKNFFSKVTSLPSLLDDAYQAVAKVYSTIELEKIYDKQIFDCHDKKHALESGFDQLTGREVEKYCHVDVSAPIIDQVKQYTSYILDRRMQDLKEIQICFEIELADNVQERVGILKENGLRKPTKDGVYSFHSGEHLVCYSEHRGEFSYVNKAYLSEIDKYKDTQKHDVGHLFYDLLDTANSFLIHPIYSLFDTTVGTYQDVSGSTAQHEEL